MFWIRGGFRAVVRPSGRQAGVGRPEGKCLASGREEEEEDMGMKSSHLVMF
jgi:hypothetical protein